MTNMYWEEDSLEKFVVPDDVVDLSFRIHANSLPLDHATILSDAIIRDLPWLQNEPRGAIHLINYPESGSGWERTEDSTDELFFVSARSRLKIRLPKTRIGDGQKLTGVTLKLGSHEIIIGNNKILPLVATHTLYAKRIIVSEGEDETDFQARIAREISELGVTPKKMLCGKSRMLERVDHSLEVRSLMLANLSFEESVTLQENGVGDGMQFGCGIFVPHKDIETVS